MRFVIGLGVAVFVVCLLAGIGYVIAVVQFSGESVGVIRHEGGDAPVDGELTLAPEMNPLRAAFEVNYSQTLGSARLYADLALRSPAGQQVWSRRLRVSDEGESGIGGSTTSSTSAKRFEVTEAGIYRLSIALDDHIGGEIRWAEVDVRRNVRVVDWRLVAGIGLVGLLGMGLTLAANFIQENAVDLSPRAQGAGIGSP